jgi:hypothetical protein
MKSEDVFTIEKTNQMVEFNKLKEAIQGDTNQGCVVLYQRQYPDSFCLQIRHINEKGKTEYAHVSLNLMDIIRMAEYAKKQSIKYSQK